MSPLDICFISEEYAWRYLLKLCQATVIPCNLDNSEEVLLPGAVQGLWVGMFDVECSRVLESVLVDLIAFQDDVIPERLVDGDVSRYTLGVNMPGRSRSE